MYREKMLKLPIYPIRLCVVETDNPQILKEKHGMDMSNETVYAHTWDWYTYDKKVKYKCVYIILNTKHPFHKIKHSTIAHECVHAANMTLHHVGVFPDFQNDEAQAYLVEYIYNIVHDFIKI